MLIYELKINYPEAPNIQLNYAYVSQCVQFTLENKQTRHDQTISFVWSIGCRANTLVPATSDSRIQIDGRQIRWTLSCCAFTVHRLRRLLFIAMKNRRGLPLDFSCQNNSMRFVAHVFTKIAYHTNRHSLLFCAANSLSVIILMVKRIAN